MTRQASCFAVASEIFHFDGRLIPSLKRLFAMLKALILFLEVPILILLPLFDDVHSCDKFFEALILDFKALFEYLEGIKRIRFSGCSRLVLSVAFQGFTLTPKHTSKIVYFGLPRHGQD